MSVNRLSIVTRLAASRRGRLRRPLDRQPTHYAKMNSVCRKALVSRISHKQSQAPPMTRILWLFAG